VANFFDLAPLEGRKEILHLEVKDFGDHKYHYDLEIGGNILKWVPDPWKFRER